MGPASPVARIIIRRTIDVHSGTARLTVDTGSRTGNRERQCGDSALTTIPSPTDTPRTYGGTRQRTAPPACFGTVATSYVHPGQGRAGRQSSGRDRNELLGVRRTSRCNVLATIRPTDSLRLLDSATYQHPSGAMVPTA